MTRVIIIGAGHAGGTAAALLRQYGHAGPILLAGEEAHPPYQRPPLSKAWLKGEADRDGLLLRPEAFYAEQGIELRTGAVAVGIDRAARTVAFADGRTEPYDALILATGSTARRLAVAGGDGGGLLALRTLDDAERLKAALAPGPDGGGCRLVVVGGGYVGLEAAASARALGARAVVIEREARVLARVASEPLSRFFTALHRERGVEVLTGAEVSGLDDRGATLADGRRIEGDAVLVGVGAGACDALARDAGLACDGGVVVDGQAGTADPAIWAVGDMTRRPVPVLGLAARLESVPNALEQAKHAAAAIAGRPAPPPEVPWFWSDQYEIKLQIAGLTQGADAQVVRGDADAAGFAVFHLKGRRVVCVEAVSAPAEFMAGRQLIARGTEVDPVRLADTATPMKAVAA